MQFECKIKSILLFCVSFLTFFMVIGHCFASKVNNAPKSVAIYYHEHIPINQLKLFDIVVIHPIKGFNPKLLASEHTKLFAYVTLGELDKDAPYRNKAKKSWIIGKNKIWKADVMDLSNPDYQKFILNDVITPLWNKGYRGFLLDTLDSYQLVSNNKNYLQKQEQGLINIIKSIKEKYPNAKLIFNRGFEVLPKIHQDVYAVAAESLYGGWNEAKKQYYTVSEADRDYLLKQLNIVKTKYHLPVISIDYANPANKEKSKAIANKIIADGFIPWVTNGAISALGYSSIDMVPRTILIIVKHNQTNGEATNSAINLVSMPLEYMGYSPKVVTLDQLPEYNLVNRVAGIVVAIQGTLGTKSKKLQHWLTAQIKNKIPVLFIDGFNFSLQSPFVKKLGINANFQTEKSTKVSLLKDNINLGYETVPIYSPANFTPLTLKQGEPLLSLKDNFGKQSDVIAIMPWGGYGLAPYLYRTVQHDQTAWIVNPFEFLKKTLRLAAIPSPDFTTENGRRIMIAHIDGDGFMNKGEWFKAPVSAKNILDNILMHYKIPTTVSVIEAEVSPKGLYAKGSRELESIAKKIFALPWVQVASHSYSHPYDWISIQKPKRDVEYNLPIKNYHFNIKREVQGSIDYINKELAPANKKVEVFLWTGVANPDEKALALTYQLGLMNMNGGDTFITSANNHLSAIAPLGRWLGNYLQVYAPVANENIYTNEWRGPFWGFQRVIETFKLTDKPKRFKPIDIYYHFYSGSKQAALNALKKVYDWALAQNPINLFVSDYSHIALDFYGTSIAKQGHSWLIYNNGFLRELRIPKAWGYPDLDKSQNIVGFSPYEQDNYIHLGPGKYSKLVMTTISPKSVYLYSANAVVTAFTKVKHGIKFQLRAYLPVQFTLANSKQCSVRADGQRLKGKIVSQLLQHYSLTGKHYAITVKC